MIFHRILSRKTGGYTLILAINGLAICDNGRWVVQNKLKKCFCDLCDPRDAQKQLQKAIKVSQLLSLGHRRSVPVQPWFVWSLKKYFQKGRKNRNPENMGDFSIYKHCTGNSYQSWTHQFIISGTCGKNCFYQPKGLFYI